MVPKIALFLADIQGKLQLAVHVPHHLWQSTPFSSYRGGLKRAVEGTLARQDDRIARITSSFVRRSKGLEELPCGGFVDGKLDNFSFRGEARSVIFELLLDILTEQ